MQQAVPGTLAISSLHPPDTSAQDHTKNGSPAAEARSQAKARRRFRSRILDLLSPLRIA